MEIEAFAQWLLEEGKATKTIESYVTDVKGFHSYLQERTNDQAVLSRFSFVRYKDHLSCLSVPVTSRTLSNRRI